MNADDNRHLADVNNCGICIGIGTHSSLDILSILSISDARCGADEEEEVTSMNKSIHL